MILLKPKPYQPNKCWRVIQLCPKFIDVCPNDDLRALQGYEKKFRLKLVVKTEHKVITLKLPLISPFSSKKDSDF